MWMPEYLGKEGNKLLKLIEEPTHLIPLFVLIAESEEQILPTILSRTQLVKIPLLEDAEVEQALIERNHTPAEQARGVAGIAQGNYHEALQLLQHSEEDWLSLLREWMNVTLKNNLPGQVKWVDEVSKLGREKQKHFFGTTITCWSNVYDFAFLAMQTFHCQKMKKTLHSGLIKLRALRSSTHSLLS
jgi:DNA polymerase-3 subunit delta'